MAYTPKLNVIRAVRDYPKAEEAEPEKAVEIDEPKKKKKRVKK